MDTSSVTAFAALTGSVLGGCALVTATFIGQRLQARGARMAADLEEHEKLYGEFVEQAVPLFVEAIQRQSIDPPKVMHLYSYVARIRLIASDEVLRAAEHVGKRLVEAYERPPEDPAEVLARFAKGEYDIDPLGEFTEACRLERARALKRV